MDLTWPPTQRGAIPPPLRRWLCADTPRHSYTRSFPLLISSSSRRMLPAFSSIIPLPVIDYASRTEGSEEFWLVPVPAQMGVGRGSHRVSYSDVTQRCSDEARGFGKTPFRRPKKKKQRHSHTLGEKEKDNRRHLPVRLPNLRSQSQSSVLSL